MKFVKSGVILLVFVSMVDTSLIYRVDDGENILRGEVAGIILSLHSGYSYDNLFRTVKQQSREGSVVLTYTADSSAQKAILEAFSIQYQHSDQTLRQFIREVQKLTPLCSSCIVFNWECSSGFSHQQFDNNGKYVYGLLELVIKRGYIAMFSDFSLKALIWSWNADILGVNPFIKIGQTNQKIIMKFDRQKLLTCPLSQLQAVARLSSSDEIVVDVMASTILFAVNQQYWKKQDRYELEVLTIASNFRAPASHLQSEINGNRGLPSHVLLSYRSGGKILVSMGHWIALMKIDTSFERVYQSAAAMFGEKQSLLMMDQYNSLVQQDDKYQYLNRKSRQYIQNQNIGDNLFMKKNSEKKGDDEIQL